MRSVRLVYPFLLLGLSAASAGAATTRHAIVVLIDGARYSETFGDPAHTWVPRMWNDLAPLGCYAGEFRNLGVTLTVPGTSAVLSGNWQALANDGSQPSQYPSMFECWRLATGAPATDAWLVTTKDKLTMLASSVHPAAGAAYAGTASLQPNDAAACTKAVAVLGQYHPSLMLLHLGDTDVAGHSGNWGAYTAALRKADSLVFVLWQAVQADTALAGRTTVFVTNDHGRHLDAYGGFTNHGDGCDGCRHILLLALGAGVRTGSSTATACSQVDVLPTVAALLSFPAPWAQGTVMEDVLAAPLAVAPAAVPGLALGPPHPNPSRGSVRFEVTLAATSDLRLGIYDAAGRTLARLFAGSLPSGRHSFAWDGRDASGHSAAAGRYLVRAESSHGIASAAFVLVR